METEQGTIRQEGRRRRVKGNGVSLRRKHYGPKPEEVGASCVLEGER